MGTIAEVKAALKTLLEGVSGIARAYSDPPRSISRADFPVAVVFIGNADYEDVGAETNMDWATRTYRLRVYVRSVGDGLDGEAEQAVEALIEPVRASLAASDRLARTCVHQRLVRDSGAVVLRYQEMPYLGVEFTVEVIT